jgi:hypothetical protein
MIQNFFKIPVEEMVYKNVAATTNQDFYAEDYTQLSSLNKLNQGSQTKLFRVTP